MSACSPHHYEVWCADRDLVARRDRFAVGEAARTRARPISPGNPQSLALMRSEAPRAYWSLTATDEYVDPVMELSWTVSEQRAVTTPLVFHTDGWVPVTGWA